MKNFMKTLCFILCCVLTLSLAACGNTETEGDETQPSTYDFSGKTIITFNTHGGSGFSDTNQTITELYAEWLDGIMKNN